MPVQDIRHAAAVDAKGAPVSATSRTVIFSRDFFCSRSASARRIRSLERTALRKLSDSYRALFLSGYGGNAFLMTVSCREESAEVPVQRFTDLLERDPAVSGLPFRFTVNIGCAIAAEGGMTVEELAGEAGHALCGKRGCCMKSWRMARERASLIRRCRRNRRRPPSHPKADEKERCGSHGMTEKMVSEKKSAPNKGREQGRARRKRCRLDLEKTDDASRQDSHGVSFPFSSKWSSAWYPAVRELTSFWLHPSPSARPGHPPFFSDSWDWNSGYQGRRWCAGG